jgi:hypothetical protein
MSNFFGALDSDDEEPTKIQTTKKVTAAKGECHGLELGLFCAVFMDVDTWRGRVYD